MIVDSIQRGLTVREVARLYRVNPQKVRLWIRVGMLGAINTSGAKCSKARLIVLPRHLEEFENKRAVNASVKKRVKKRTTQMDYYPD
jgi:hypothetical protein